MPTVHSGIDEAGYGPLLGPLAIVSVSVAADEGVDPTRALRRARLGIKDSKEVHTPGEIVAIETVALAAVQWLTGAIPETAASLFALLGESLADRVDKPWMLAAETLRLPIAATRIKTWRVPGLAPLAVSGRLIQPCRFNRLIHSGINKADLELIFVRELLQGLPETDAERRTVIDRLGGRRYYGAFLHETWPTAAIAIVSEEVDASRYRLAAGPIAHEIAFCVEGERESALTAMASCVAKYAREVHMHLFNTYWLSVRPDLRPTAGYTTDARRWLAALGEASLALHGEILVRGHGFRAAEDDQADTSAATRIG
jgi:ribonuclease HII